LNPDFHTTKPGRVAMLEAFVDAPLCHESLTVFPVIAPHGPVLPYLLSTEIEDASVLTVRERGDVPEPVLLARNNSLHPLLILAKEPLPGESPGRLVQRSILLGGKSVTQIPASPMERGDWVSLAQESEITEWLEHFPETKDQVGFLAFQGNRMMGLEALGSPNLYGPLHRRLLVRFVKMAFKHPDGEKGDPKELQAQAQRIVGAIDEADRLPTKRIGVGEYCSLTGPVAGGDLTYQGHLVHLTVESANPEWASFPSHMEGAECS
jgi:hypothetical protein